MTANYSSWITRNIDIVLSPINFYLESNRHWRLILQAFERFLKWEYCLTRCSYRLLEDYHLIFEPEWRFEQKDAFISGTLTANFNMSYLYQMSNNERQDVHNNSLKKWRELCKSWTSWATATALQNHCWNIKASIVWIWSFWLIHWEGSEQKRFRDKDN